MDKLWQDVKYGVRMLVKNRVVTLVAVLTLALGIGANAAIFSVVDAVLLRSLPYPEPERIVHLFWQWSQGRGGDYLPPMQYEFWRDQQRTFSAIGTAQGTSFNLATETTAERVPGASASEAFFSVLGVHPIAGRFFTAEEDRPGGPAVAVLTYGFWQRVFGGDRAAIGSTVRLNGKPHQVIGILPASFFFESPAEVWVPMQLRTDPANSLDRRGMNYLTVARLKPGVSLSDAQADLRRISALYREQDPEWFGLTVESRTGGYMALEPYQEWAAGQFRTVLPLLLGAVGLVLLIACANVVNLLLSRLAARQREMAVRRALGATGGQILRQLFFENLTLTLAGAAVGLLIGQWTLELLLAVEPTGSPLLTRVGLDARVVGFTVLVAVAIGVVLAIAASWDAVRAKAAQALKVGWEGGAVTRGRRRLAGALVSAQVALSVILLVGASLLVVTLLRLYGTQLGFDPRNLVAVQLSLASERYQTAEATWRFEQQLLEQVRGLPGVVTVATASNVPLVRGLNNGLWVVGTPEDQQHYTEYRAISPDYFRTLGMRLLRGREFRESDLSAPVGAAIINEAMARRAWPNQEALGQRFVICKGCGLDEEPVREVIGIVSDAREVSLGRPAIRTVFVPRSHASTRANTLMNRAFFAALLVRTSGPIDLAQSVRGIVRSLDPEVPVVKTRPMEQVARESLVWQPFLGKLLGLFAVLGLALATVGLYGVLSYQVARRTREIGVRMALGAQRGNVLGLVFRQGMLLVAIGLAVGLGGAFGLTRLLKGLLYGVKPTDPATFTAVAAALAVVALAACYVPARRAMKVDPVVALRYE